MSSEQEIETRNEANRPNRRGPMELYRPAGAMSYEERIKHRQRGHFGENKLPASTEQQQQQQPNGDNGSRRGQNQRRGGGFGRSRGRGVRDYDRHNNGDNNYHRNNRNDDNYEHDDRTGGRNGGYNGGRNGDNFNSYRNGENSYNEQSSPSYENNKLDEYDINPPSKITNWADEEYEDDYTAATPATTTAPSNDPPVQASTGEEPALDLRDKLKAMRLGRGDQQQQQQQQRSPLQPSNDQQYYNGNRQQQQQQQRQHKKPVAPSYVKTVAGNLPLPKRNTENFEPSYAPPEMRILCARSGLKHYDRPYSTRDVLVVNDLFCDPDDLTIYNSLLDEIKNSGVDPRQLWQLWHGDSHVIADDKRKWKKECPTFTMIVDKIADYFHMDVKATRLNWYRDSTEWKPFHHDAAAVKADKARTQNFTVAVSFGMERDAAFEHAKTKTVISMPQPNGTIYTFGRDVNILWRHGIPQVPPELHQDQGRISIIAWGWNEQFDL